MNIKYLFFSVFFLCSSQTSAMLWSIPQEVWESKEQKQYRLNKCLGKCIRRGQTEKAISYLDQGAHVDGFDPKTVLKPLPQAIQHNRLVLIGELVARGAKIDATFSLHKGKKHPQLLFQGTPLAYAASKRNVQAVELLLWTLPQSPEKAVPITPPKELIEQHLEFLTQLLLKEEQTFENSKIGWQTQLPCYLTSLNGSIPAYKKKKIQRLIALLTPKGVDHREGIETLLHHANNF